MKIKRIKINKGGESRFLQKKKAVSEMISYVILIAIGIGLSIGVFIWLKDFANVSPKIDCKDGTSLRLDNYSIEGGAITLTLKNNGNFNISGFILTVGNDTRKMPIELLPPMNGCTSTKLGYCDFSSALSPNSVGVASFIVVPAGYNIKVIQIQPYIKDEKGKTIVCEKSIIKQDASKPLINLLLIPSLVSWWKFDETSGTTASDSKDGNTGTLTNMDNSDWVSGKSGNALSFDGTSDYVDAGNSSSLNINNTVGEISSFAWVYWKGSSIDGEIVAKGGNFGYRYRIDTSNLLRVFINGGGNRLVSTATIPLNQWTFVGFTSNSTNTALYINTMRAAQNSVAYFVSNVGSSNFTIGKDIINGENFNGTIDDVMIFNESLDAATIQNIYCATGGTTGC